MLRRYTRFSTLILIVVLVVLGCPTLVFLNQVYEWFTLIDPGPDVVEKDQVLNQIATPVAELPASIWDNHIWLDQTAALALRERADVINLAQLKKNGGVLYSASASAVLNQVEWSTLSVRPFGLTALSVTGTSVSLSAFDHDFVLNVFQPFFLFDQPDTMYLVDATGQIWETSIANVVELKAATNQLPLELAINSQLSLSY